MKKSSKQKFSQAIRTLREARDLTQQDLAEIAGLDYKHIQRMEGKNPSDPKLDTIEKLAQAFKIPTWKLIKSMN